MTGAEWKELVLNAAVIVQTEPYLMELMDNPVEDTREALNVILEVLPQKSPEEVRKAMMQLKESEGLEALRPFVNLKKQLAKAKTDEEVEELSGKILEQAMSLLNVTDLLNLNPSYEYLTE